MAPVTLHFLPAATANVRRTKREAELIDAEAKSHARSSSFAQSESVKPKGQVRTKSAPRSVLQSKTNPDVSLPISKLLSGRYDDANRYCHRKVRGYLKFAGGSIERSRTMSRPPSAIRMAVIPLLVYQMLLAHWTISCFISVSARYLCFGLTIDA